MAKLPEQTTIYDTVVVDAPNRNKFNLSFNNLFTTNAGRLTPFAFFNCVPGDTFRVNTFFKIEAAPLKAPAMQDVDISVHWFAVPRRLLQRPGDFYKYYANQPALNGEVPVPSYCFLKDLVDYSGYAWQTTEQYELNIWPFPKGTLLDYFSYLPVGDVSIGPDDWTNLDNSTVWRLDRLLAYQLIWSEYYRDENLQDEFDIAFFENGGPLVLEDMIQSSTNADCFQIRQRCYNKDYFTAALPFAQKGEAVTLPLYGSATIDNLNLAFKMATTEVPALGADNEFPVFSYIGEEVDERIDTFVKVGKTDTAGGQLHEELGRVSIVLDPRNKSTANLSTATGVEINQLRALFALQRVLEINAICGTRPYEFIHATFGVTVPDSRLQRPEYIGGGSVPLMVNETAQTEGTATDPASTLSGRAAAYNSQQGLGFEYYISEPTYIIGIMSILPKQRYFQGVPRDLTSVDPYDEYNPMFAHLGEQAIKNRELYFDYFDPDGSVNGGDFGYQSRYAEYRSRQSEIHGDFVDSLSFYHASRKFENLPQLTDEFIQCQQSDLDNVFAVSARFANSDYFLCNFDVQVEAVRPLPFFATPAGL